MKTGRPEGADPTSALEFTAYRTGVDIAAAQLIALAEHINSDTEMLTDMPLQPVDNGAEAATDTPNEDRDATAAVVANIHTQTNGIVALAKRLPTLAPKRDEGYTRLELNDYIDEVTDRIQATSRSLIIKELNPIRTVLAAEADIYLMLTNIMENAVLAIQERGQKKGIIRVETRQNSDSTVVTVTDNGIGIPPERRKKVFQPFYTTREGALGMGLTSTQHLVEKYGGTILINSMPNQGTAVRLTLPSSSD